MPKYRYMLSGRRAAAAICPGSQSGPASARTSHSSPLLWRGLWRCVVIASRLCRVRDSRPPLSPVTMQRQKRGASRIEECVVVRWGWQQALNIVVPHVFEACPWEKTHCMRRDSEPSRAYGRPNGNQLIFSAWRQHHIAGPMRLPVAAA